MMQVGVWTQFLAPVLQCSNTFEIRNAASSASNIRIDDIDVLAASSVQQTLQLLSQITPAVQSQSDTQNLVSTSSNFC